VNTKKLYEIIANRITINFKSGAKYMSVPNRIHIIGSTGSGKTYLAQILSKNNNLTYGELDTVMWSGKTEFAGKNPPEVRERLLQDIIDEEKWVVEGIYYKWLGKSFERADVIFFF
jgi:adenylate kinase family enzyme